MRRKLLLFTGIILFSGVSAVRADEAARAAKAEEYLRVSHTEQMLSQSMSTMLTQTKSGMLQQMFGVTLTPEQTKASEELQDKLAVILTNALSWEKLKPLYIKVYADAFTEEELDGIIAFYKSPAGQAMIAKTPALMTKSAELVQQQMATAMPEIQKLMKDFTARQK
jgi:uncharacterized protein